MKRITFSLGATAVVCLFSWLLGFDFNERGDSAFVTAYLALFAFGIAYVCFGGEK